LVVLAEPKICCFGLVKKIKKEFYDVGGNNWVQLFHVVDLWKEKFI
jgi:hypothetical protein